MLETKIIAPGPTVAAPRVVAVFSYRYDAHLVPDLLANIGPAIHGYVAWDDRAAADRLTSEPDRRRLLLQAAREMGAQWILAADPDERYEDGLAARMAGLTGQGPVIWNFDCREMFGPDVYRVDGIWGGRTRARLFPLTVDAGVPDAALHGQWLHYGVAPPSRHAGLNFYHLRMASPARRKLRRNLYASEDPQRRFQAVGYDYLDDERGMVLESIPPERRFSPAHIEDDGLWAPESFLPESPPPDPPASRLRLMARLARMKAPVQHIAHDLTEAARDDPDLAIIAADQAARAGLDDLARAHLRRAMALQPGSAAAALVGARCGDADHRRRMAGLAVQAAPDSLVARQTQMRQLPAQQGLRHPQALWRRWFDGPATLHEGPDLAQDAPMAVVVIGFRAPANLATAVQSLRDQDHPVEIVVVNTGGGDARRVLRDHLGVICLVDVMAPCVVGRARNIGIDASHAPIVGFLASDCLALPGWVAHRLARHRAGAAAVSSAVVPVNSRSLSSLAASCWLHRRRWPGAVDELRARHGFSYARDLLDSRGYFPIGPQVAEDTIYNERIYDSARNDWAPEVLTAHAYPTHPFALIADMFARGQRRTPGEVGPLIGTEKNLWREMSARLLRRHLLARQASFDLPGLGPVRRLAVRQLIRLVRFSDLAGIYLTLARLRPEQLRSMTGTARAERLAAALPMSAPAQMALAAERDAAGVTGDADRLRARAHDLAPDLSGPILDRCTALDKSGAFAAAADVAERAAIMSPRQTLHLRRMRHSALKAGQGGRALLSAQLCLLDAPWDPIHHRNLAQVYRGLGQDKMAAMRDQMAEALEQVP